MATIREIAAAAGVSTATVSRVVNGGVGVEPGLAKRVQGVIDEYGYTPNLVARGLRMQATKVIALVIADIENPFFTSVCRGVEDAARRHDFSVMLCNTDESVTKEAGYLEILAAQSVAGVIISAASSTSSVSALTNRGISVVAIGRKLGPEIDFVGQNHTLARTLPGICSIWSPQSCLHHRATRSSHGRREARGLPRSHRERPNRTRSRTHRVRKFP